MKRILILTEDRFKYLSIDLSTILKNYYSVVKIDIITNSQYYLDNQKLSKYDLIIFDSVLIFKMFGYKIKSNMKQILLVRIFDLTVDYNTINDINRFADGVILNIFNKNLNKKFNSIHVRVIITNEFIIENTNKTKNGSVYGAIGAIESNNNPLYLFHTIAYLINNSFPVVIEGNIKTNELRYKHFFTHFLKPFIDSGLLKFEDENEFFEKVTFLINTDVDFNYYYEIIYAMKKGLFPLLLDRPKFQQYFDKQFKWTKMDDIKNELTYDDDISIRSELRKYFFHNNGILKWIEGFIPKNETNKKCPLVTIGIPVYNGEKYISKCLESILNQSYENIEVIVVDDASKDNTTNIVKRFVKFDQRVRLKIHQNNSGGMSKAIQEIINESKGKFFQWIAHDDYLKKDAIKIMVKAMNDDHRVDYVYCNFEIVNSYDDPIGKWKYRYEDKSVYVRNVFKKICSTIPLNGLYRKKYFDKKGISWIKFKDNDFSCDTINGLYFFKNGMNAFHLNEELFCYRQHESNLSLNHQRRIISDLRVIQYIFENYDTEEFIFETSVIKITKYQKDLFYLIKLKQIIDDNKKRFHDIEKSILSETFKYISINALSFIDKENVNLTEDIKLLSMYFKKIM